MKPRFRVIAHRGASAHAPENTLPAFASAVACGAREVELDVRFSSDHEIIVFHDDALDRKTDREGRVSHYTAATLRRTRIGPWFHRTHPQAEGDFSQTCIAGLAEVLALLGTGVHYHVEIKGSEDTLPLRLLEQLDAAGVLGQATLTSFSLRPLEQVRSVAPEVPLCFLLRDAADAMRSAEFRPELEGLAPDAVQAYWIDAAAAAGFEMVGVRAADASLHTREHAQRAGVALRGWGVRDIADLHHLEALGAVGATVDWPAQALAALA